MLTGAGVLQAYDERSPGNGSLHGLLQSISYVGGISGGSWLVMSNFVNDFKPVHSIMEDNIWSLQSQLLEGIPNFDPKKLTLSHINTINEIDTNIKPNAFVLLLRFLGIEIETRKSSIMNLDSKILKFLNNLLSMDNSTKVDQAKRMMQVFNFYNEIHLDVLRKKASGFPVSLTDYWGRALSKKLFSIAVNNSGVRLSACTSLPSFRKYEQPFPIICSIEKDILINESSEDSHIFEITPFEFGSWDSYLASFIPVKYLGTPLLAGYSIKWNQSSNKTYCYSGLDNVGFVTATSSSLFNHVIARIFDIIVQFSEETTTSLATILKAFSISIEKPLAHNLSHPEYAILSPNPFLGLSSKKSTSGRDICSKKHLYFVDGGDDGQNIPFHPFLRHQRPVDLILAYDLSSDVMNFPNGSCLLKSSLRYHNLNSSIELPYFEIHGRKKFTFPYAPTPQQYVQLNLSKRPLFLGCNLDEDYPNMPSRDSTDSPGQYLPPLIIYQGNTNHSFPSNTSTFQLSYTPEQVHGMITNGYNLATFNNSTFYAKCVQCAMLKREFDRITLGWNKYYSHDNFTIPPLCRRCFAEFCWKPMAAKKDLVTQKQILENLSLSSRDNSY